MTRPSDTPETLQNADELRDDPERVREGAAADVEAFGKKQSPSNLEAEAKPATVWRSGSGADCLREGDDGPETTIVGFCCDNAIPLSLLGAGLGLLIYNNRRHGGHALDAAKKR